MNNLSSCDICDTLDSVLLFDAVPKHLCIPGENNFELFLCIKCLDIKKILDDHISLTSGERHSVKGVKKFISLYEYWSDWSTNMDLVQKNNHDNVNFLKPWNSFSFATGQFDFQSKKDALEVMLDYRHVYKKNFHILSFRTYQDVLNNVTTALLKEMLPSGKKHLTIIDDPVYGDTKLVEWVRYKHVRLFLSNIKNCY